MTPDELKQFFRDLEIPPRENTLDNSRQEAREQEERRFACEREKSRNLTDSEMQRWHDYFHELIASERAATAKLGERNFQREVMARALGEIQQEIEDRNKQAIDTALAGVRASIEALSQEITKRETIDTAAIVELPNPLARHDAA
jgi:hypothetical protein